VRAKAARLALAARALRNRRAVHARERAIDDALRDQRAPLTTPAVTVIDLGFGAGYAAAVARTAPGELLCFMPVTTQPLGAHWLAHLTWAIGADVGAATPQTVHPDRPWRSATPHDGLVRARGVELSVRDGVPVARNRAAGTVVDVTGAPEPVAGASAACLVVDRAAYDAAGGLPASSDPDVAVFELCRRLDAIGRTTVVVPAAVVRDARPVASARALTEAIPAGGPAWRALVEQDGSALMRAAAPLAADRFRFALTVAAPNTKVAPRWGDWHLAGALARALQRLGHETRVQTLDHADDLAGRACDVHIVLHGLGRVRRTAGQRHVLWIISHPETVDIADCDAADLVLVASHRFAAALRSRTSTPVEVLLQATDTDRFRPLEPDPRHAHDVVVVAKTRDVARSVVTDALAAGLRPAIYGSGWEQFVDPSLVVSQYVPNEELPHVYASAGVLLNDHWGDMRAHGFVSNRIFDALACGTPVISDELPEIDELFGDAVATYGTPEELRALVAAALADQHAARARAARGGDIVRAEHSMHHRARELLEALNR
jgi:glycosyltransferase involved in cell wall biosynthesis